MRNLFFQLFSVSVLTLCACGGDDDGPVGLTCTSQAFSQDVSAAVSDLNDAAVAFANDQTAANCDAYKESANDYLDVVQRYDNCAGINRADFQRALDEAREAVADIMC